MLPTMVCITTKSVKVLLYQCKNTLLLLRLVLQQNKVSDDDKTTRDLYFKQLRRCCRD